jgi:Ca2+-binding RTX toxin-like protein
MNGQVGDDRVESTITMEATPDLSSRILNRINGDVGNDELVARLEMPGWDDDPVSATNKLDGAEGHDLLTAEVVGQGRSILYGGSGKDELQVSGGSNNLLSGEGGDDRLFAGSGSESLIGGAGVDDFVFDVTADQGTDQLLDFDGLLDRLCFVGITDQGANGIADDLDAISSFTHGGPGGDLIATFDSGSVIRFVGCDLGTDFMRQPLIDSFADLVEAPQAQLLIEL